MKKSPEPIILAIFLVLLALGAVLLAYMFPSPQDLTGVPSTIPTGHSPKKLNAEDLQASLEPWNTPALWNEPENKHQLFISDGFLFYASAYPGGDYIQKDDGTARTPAGVLISWYRKYGLDFTDPNVDREDPDNDGFSNITEFKNEVANAKDVDGTKSTNPLDPQSHPSYLSRLRLQQYESRPFHILFRGYDKLNGTDVFQLYLKDAPSSEQPGFKKTGDLLGVEDYTVGPFVESIVDEKDPATGLVSPVNRSTLELDKPAIGFKILLPYRQEIDSPESTADLVMLMPSEVDKVIKVARGKTFSIPFVPDVTYILIDVKDTGATIQDVKTKANIQIPKLDPAEWNEVPVPAASSSAKTP